MKLNLTSIIQNKNYLYLLYLPILLNFLFNFIRRFSIENVKLINYYDLFSTLVYFLFIFLVGFLIKEVFSFHYISTGIVLYFLSFFVVDNIVLFFYKGLNFSQSFIFLNLVWVLIFLIFSSRKFLIIVSIFFYYFLNFFNENFYKLLTTNINIIGDVKDIHYQHVKNIYEFSYFYSINNPALEGYPQISAYVHSVINIISQNTDIFNHFSSSTNSLFLLFILFFLEVEISQTSKAWLVAVFSSLLFNSQWLKFLFIDSLMTEGVLSYLFLVLMFSCLKQINNLSTTSYLVFFMTGLLYLSKQFFSTLALALIIIFIFKKETSKYALTGLFGVVLKELNYLTIFSNIQKNYHLKDVDLIDTIFDLLLFRDLNFKNITTIFQNLTTDKPVFILFLYLFIMTLIFLFKTGLKYEEINIALFVIVLNFLLIFALYVTIWQSMELESPIRYMLNLLPVVLIFQFKIIDYFRIKIKKQD